MYAMNIVLIVMFGVVVVVVSLAGFALDDTFESSFKDYEEMAASGIFEVGWLPPYLPKSSVNIQEVHDIDTNEVSAVFSYNPADVSSVRTNCRLQAEKEDVTVFNCEYRGNEAVLKLFKNGNAEYNSAR